MGGRIDFAEGAGITFFCQCVPADQHPLADFDPAEVFFRNGNFHLHFLAGRDDHARLGGVVQGVGGNAHRRNHTADRCGHLPGNIGIRDQLRRDAAHCRHSLLGGLPVHRQQDIPLVHHIPFLYQYLLGNTGDIGIHRIAAGRFQPSGTLDAFFHRLCLKRVQGHLRHRFLQCIPRPNDPGNRCCRQRTEYDIFSASHAHHAFPACHNLLCHLLWCRARKICCAFSGFYRSGVWEFYRLADYPAHIPSILSISISGRTGRIWKAL